MGKEKGIQEMKLTISKLDLVAALGAAQAATPSKSTRPVLEYVLVVVEGGRTNLYATDLEVSLRVAVPKCESSGDGRFLLPAKRALALVRSFDGDDVTLEPAPAKPGEGSRVRVSDGWSKFSLDAYDAESFPDLTHLAPKAPAMTLPAGFLDALARVAWASDDTPNNTWAMEGVSISGDGARVRVAATDGKKIAFEDVAAPVSFPEMVLSQASLGGVRAAFEGGDGPLGLTVSESSALWTSGGETGATVGALFMRGKFPPVDSAVKGHDLAGHARVEVDRAALAGALKRLAAVIDGKLSHGVTLRLSKGELALDGAAAGMGTGTTRIKVAHDGPEVETMAAHRYLCGAVENAPGAKVWLLLASSERGAPIVVEGAAPAVWRAFVMPMASDPAPSEPPQAGEDEKPKTKGKKKQEAGA